MTDQRGAHRRWLTRRWVILLAALALIVVLATALNTDLGGWVAGVASDIRRIPPRYIALACALKALESIFTAVAWRNILRAAFPDEPISFRFVLGAYQGGVGINSVTPANAGTVLMLGLYRLAIRGATTPAILSAAVVQNLFFVLLTVLTWVVLFLINPTALEAAVDGFNGTSAFVADHRALALVAGVVVALLIGVLIRWLWRRLLAFWQRALSGVAILRTPRRYLSHAVLPQFLSYVCRWGVTATFLAAFGIPVTVATVFLVVAANSLANAVQVTPGGLGTTQALLVIALSAYADAETVTAYSLAETSILAIWNAAFGFAALTVAFGVSGVRNILRRRSSISSNNPTESDGVLAAAIQPGDGMRPEAREPSP